MSSPFKTAYFRALFKKWNKILEKDGYSEIEDFTQDDPLLKTWISSRWNWSDEVRLECRQAYYEMAEALLDKFKFKNRNYRKIWELHCKGISPREIAKHFKNRKISKSTIYNIIFSIEVDSGLRDGRDKHYYKKR